MATNNNGNLLDSSGNVFVDFVWGNFPVQPNDVRTETAASNIGGGTGSSVISYKTAVVTAASGNGTTITYTSANSFIPGDLVTITGLSTSGANLTGATIATASSSNFTVTNATSVSDTGQTAVAKVAISTLPGVGADSYWSATTQVTGARLDLAGTSAYSGSGAIANKTVYSANHELEAAAYSGYPAFTPGTGKYQITQATGDGTTIRYESFNFLTAGDTVNITGLGALNLSSATVASATRDYFTVTNATTGSIINVNNGIVALTNELTAADGAYVAGVAYINVPSVIGDTTTLALDELKDAGYATANITTAAGATNTATQITNVNATTTTSATLTIAGGTTSWPVGTKVTITAGTGIPAALVGTFSVTGGSGSTLIVSGTGFTVANSGAITPGTVLKGTAATIKTQSTAAGTASVLSTATITITPWAA
jgi:hypothetical protein